MIYTTSYTSPLGPITLASDGKVLTGLWFDGQTYFGHGLSKDATEKDLPIFHEAKRWLTIYFSGKEPDFLPPLNYDSTPFRKQVFDILLTIPYGKTITYGDIAKKIAKERGISHMSAQAIGGAVGHNPISLMIPCHRVVGKNGNLTGYAGGLQRKAALLRWEQGKDSISK